MLTEIYLKAILCQRHFPYVVVDEFLFTEFLIVMLKQLLKQKIVQCPIIFASKVNNQKTQDTPDIVFTVSGKFNWSNRLPLK